MKRIKFSKDSYFIRFILFVIIISLAFSCDKDKLLREAKVITGTISEIMPTSAKASGEIVDLGQGISDHGHCWDLDSFPTVADSKTSLGIVDTTGIFTSDLQNLRPSKSYHVRAYVKSGNGHVYGDDVIFTTAPLTLNDVDGNTYLAITIGYQVWMAENLKTTRYSNGDLIGTTTPATLDISGESTPKYQWAYDGNESNVATYGRLYTWYAVTDPRNICPTGWHVPTYFEWIVLGDRLGWASGGGKLKESGTTHWQNPNTSATNYSGFTALPGGFRYETQFGYMGYYGYWWTATEYENDPLKAIDFILCYNESNLFENQHPKNWSFSVRCLKDN
jgi:uncharacterized protein (TIGR02145 family)